MSAHALKFMAQMCLRATRMVLALSVLSAGLARGEDSPARASDSWSYTPKLLVFYVLLLAAFLFGLHLVDSLQAYAFSRKTRDKLLEKLGLAALSPEQIAKMAGQFTPTGVPGTTRSLVTYALLATLAIAVFHFVAVSKFEKAPEYADKILTILAGAFSSIIGFYFGSKAMKEGAESVKQPPEEPLTPPGEISKVTPKRAKPGDEVQIEGKGFGEQPGTVKFGVISADKTEDWKDRTIKVKVPRNAEVGPRAVTVNPAHGKEIVGSPTLFEVAPPGEPKKEENL